MKNPVSIRDFIQNQIFACRGQESGVLAEDGELNIVYCPESCNSEATQNPVRANMEDD